MQCQRTACDIRRPVKQSCCFPTQSDDRLRQSEGRLDTLLKRISRSARICAGASLPAIMPHDTKPRPSPASPGLSSAQNFTRGNVGAECELGRFRCRSQSVDQLNIFISSALQILRKVATQLYINLPLLRQLQKGKERLAGIFHFLFCALDVLKRTHGQRLSHSRQVLAYRLRYSSRRPSIALAIVTSSAYSISLPAGIPVAMRVSFTGELLSIREM